ncbi:hypothetical protein P3L10_032998 [Capsicum annuum]|uniref:uncharacterized protein LOC107852662 n=1 Tax=Capsicum annuum TaxID=4072 RepID=UPI0007BFDEE1|nr:uncharacterized protein LOC107852662 [Capsicum annuum]
MDRSKEEIMANDVAANALPKTRECAISVGPSIGKSTSTSHKLPKGSTSASSGMLDSDDMNRNVTSMKGPQSHDAPIIKKPIRNHKFSGNVSINRGLALEV